MVSRNKKHSDSAKGIPFGESKCVICGWNKLDYKGRTLVIGSHVRPFKNQSYFDSFNNIIPLCPNHHIEFDRGNLMIDPESKIIFHINKSDEFHGKKIVGKINHVLKGYFDYHKKHIFKGSE
jgi:predicted restriction endonuclease